MQRLQRQISLFFIALGVFLVWVLHANRAYPVTEGWLVFQAHDNQWIYYSNAQDHGNLHRMSIDGRKDHKLVDEASTQIAMADGWVYFVNDNGLHRVRQDGSDIQLISADEPRNFNVQGDWVYYVDLSDRAIYTVRTDGSKKRQVSAGPSDDLICSGGWLFYVNSRDGSLYRSPANEFAPQKIRVGPIFRFIIHDGWIYFVDTKDNFSLNKMDFNGQNLTKISDDWVEDLRAEGDWLFYTVKFGSERTYRIRVDGTGKELVEH